MSSRQQLVPAKPPVVATLPATAGPGTVVAIGDIAYEYNHGQWWETVPIVVSETAPENVPTNTIWIGPQLESATPATVNTDVPIGGIIMYSGDVASLPSEWLLCDGTNGTPDLRDRFIVGAGGTYAQGDTGGSDAVTLTSAQMPIHTHTGPSHSHAVGSLSADSSGSHSHGIPYRTNDAVDHNHKGTTSSLAQGGTGAGENWSTTLTDINTIADGAHAHTISGLTAADGTGNTGSAGSGEAHENRPPYYALAYIMRVDPLAGGGGGGGGIAGALHSYDAQSVADAGTADLDQVQLWEDQGSGGIDAVAYLSNISNDPEFIASGINGLPSLRFESSEGLRIPLTGPIPQPTTIIAVVQKSDTSTGYISTGPNPDVEAGHRNDIYYTDGPGWRMVAGSFVAPSPAVPVVAGEPQIVMAVFNGADSRFWINGAWTGGLDAGTNDLDEEIWLGTNWDQDFVLRGLMAEWHLVPEAWDQTQCDDVGAGLATKYGITLT